MDILTIPASSARKKADLLVIPFWKGKKGAESAISNNPAQQLCQEALASGDFLGKEGETLILYTADLPEKRILLLGIGNKEDISTEKLRRVYSQSVKFSQKKQLKEINFYLPESVSMSREDVLRGAVEGMLLANYVFTSLKHDTVKTSDEVVLTKATLIGGLKQDKALIEKLLQISESVYMARDLVNGNADDVTPQHLAAVAVGLQKTCANVKTTVFDKKRIEKEQMGLLLAVNRGSSLDPAFIITEYRGNPKSSDVTVIIGKGITFDTGGLLIKPRGGMETMKCDMAGAAAVLAVIHAAANLQLKVNVTAVVAATENSTGSRSYKPGDVYKGYSGKTIEIIDTDAEGRLVLADAIAYAVDKLKPSRIIDIATLTGAVEVALGDEATGMLSNNDVLADLFLRCGSETGERVWRLPLFEEYKESLKSNVADLKNSGGRLGGCQKAAVFLHEFVGNTPWVHLDIAGTAFIPEGKRYWPKYATGVGVRMILAFLESHR